MTQLNEISNEENDNCDCYFCHRKSHIEIGNCVHMCRLVAENLESIVKWHEKLQDTKGEILACDHLNDYILTNRMENIKSVFYMFKENHLIPEDMTNHYAVTHIVIEEEMKINKTFKNIYILFIDYIKITKEILEYVFEKETEEDDKEIKER